MESEDKNCASCKWSVRNNQEGIISEPSVASRSPVDLTATVYALERAATGTGTDISIITANQQNKRLENIFEI